MASKGRKPKRHRALRTKISDQILEDGLAAVREGRDPDVDSVPTLGTRKVIDPRDPETTYTVVVQLRGDPIGRMHKCRMLGNDNIADVRLEAARRWQTTYREAKLGEAKGIDISKDRVDGGIFQMPDTKRPVDAWQKRIELRDALGLVHVYERLFSGEISRGRFLRSTLLDWILGCYDKCDDGPEDDDKCLSLTQIAERHFGIELKRLTLHSAMVETLDMLAVELGLAMDSKQKRYA